jgi:hypothetical protein
MECLSQPGKIRRQQRGRNQGHKHCPTAKPLAVRNIPYQGAEKLLAVKELRPYLARRAVFTHPARPGDRRQTLFNTLLD